MHTEQAGLKGPVQTGFSFCSYDMSFPLLAGEAVLDSGGAGRVWGAAVPSCHLFPRSVTSEERMSSPDCSGSLSSHKTQSGVSSKADCWF